MVAGLALTAGLLTGSSVRADPSSTSPQQGFDLGQIPSPRSLAFGGAQAALGGSTTAVYLNPANMPFTHVYHFEALGGWIPEAARQTYGGAVADSVTNKVAGGFGGSWSTMDPEGLDRTWTDLRLATAYPIAPSFALGLTGRYLRVDQTVGRGPFGPSLASDGTPDSALSSLFTFDAGLTFRPIPQLSIAALGKNLTNPGRGFAPTTVTGAVGYTTPSEIFSAEFDALVDFTTWGDPRGTYSLGAELFLVNHLLLRLGYRIDTGMKTHALSGGLGYVDRRFSVETSIRRDIVADHPSTMFVLGLKYFYDAGATPDQAMSAD